MERDPTAVAGVVLGLGLGAFLDGILLHQVLQWHHLTSARTDDVSANILADGLFHVAALLLTLAGVALLVRAKRLEAGRPRGRALGSATVLGIGLFNVLDSVLNHWLLGTHHIRPDGPGGTFAWDLGFFLLALAFAGAGWWGLRRAARRDDLHGRRAPRGLRGG